MDAALVTVISPTVALLVSEGESSAITGDGQTFVTPLAQTLVLVLSGRRVEGAACAPVVTAAEVNLGRRFRGGSACAGMSRHS